MRENFDVITARPFWRRCRRAALVLIIAFCICRDVFADAATNSLISLTAAVEQLEKITQNPVSTTYERVQAYYKAARLYVVAHDAPDQRKHILSYYTEAVCESQKLLTPETVYSVLAVAAFQSDSELQFSEMVKVYTWIVEQAASASSLTNKLLLPKDANEKTKTVLFRKVIGALQVSHESCILSLLANANRAGNDSRKMHLLRNILPASVFNGDPLTNSHFAEFWKYLARAAGVD